MTQNQNKHTSKMGIIILPNHNEALELILNGFMVRHPHIRLFFLEQEQTWLNASALWDGLKKRKIYVNAGVAADYI